MEMMKKINLDDDYYKYWFKHYFNDYNGLLCKVKELENDITVDLAEQIPNFYNIIKIAEDGKHGCESCMLELKTWVHMYNILLLTHDSNGFLFTFIANYVEALRKERQKESIKNKTEVLDMGAKTKYKTLDEDVVGSWDEYFFNVAKQAARNSKCFSRRIGAILVKDNIVISTGYNGPPRGIPPCERRWGQDPSLQSYMDEDFDIKKVRGVCPRKIIGAKSGTQMELCPASHAEENTILNCARLGISTKNTTMYMACGIPCNKCMTKIINAGVIELVVTDFTYYDELSKYLLDKSEIKVRRFDFIHKEAV